MNWREILSKSTDLTIQTDLRVCADWCEDLGHNDAAEQIREWSEMSILMIDGEPFIQEFYPVFEDISGEFISCEQLCSLFNRKEMLKFYEHFKKMRRSVSGIIVGPWDGVPYTTIPEAIRDLRHAQYLQYLADKDYDERLNAGLEVPFVGM